MTMNESENGNKNNIHKKQIDNIKGKSTQAQLNQLAIELQVKKELSKYLCINLVFKDYILKY